MARNVSKTLDPSLLYSKIKYKHLLSEQTLTKKYPYAVEFLKARNLLGPGNLREAGKLLASGALASSLMLSSPSIVSSPPKTVEVSQISLTQALTNRLANILPPQVGPLTSQQEEEISRIIKEIWGINAVATLEGNHLNQTYGLIGAEQHLFRFPGDTLEQHGQFLSAGIAPGLGCWGYFANSKKNLTEDLIEKEKYYVAVQTLYLPDWHLRTKELSQWYKYRKVLVINPVNGKSIVAVVADAGPASWTGKHFGGSPEVMAFLELNVAKQKGPVILFFVDDKENDVPLGPLEYNLAERQLLTEKR